MERYLHLRTSDHKNSYIYDRKEEYLIFIHPILCNIMLLCESKELSLDGSLENFCEKMPEYSKNDIDYYLEKYKHYVSNGLYVVDSPFVKPYSKRINPFDIKLQLANISQIVFEVTDRCNLNCYYCGYGRMYEFYDKRENQDLNENVAFTLIDYMENLWVSSLLTSADKKVCISFYGGEPLMNVPLIKKIITYIESKHISGIVFYYSMTTNGVLLKKYMDFLVKYDFRLLISLDGNSFNNYYRVFKNGKQTFELVMKNVSVLKEKYPEYFRNNVNFNSVLHNRNSVSDIYGFFNDSFSKKAMISELNNMGVRNEYKNEFLRMYQNINDSLEKDENCLEIEKDLFVLLPKVKDLVYFIHRYANNVFYSYNDFFKNKNENVTFMTGTCFPFSRKLFVTTHGKILQCERIAHEYYLGKVDANGVSIDFEEISRKINRWYSNVENQCVKCMHLGKCSQCMYYIDDLNDKPVCKRFATIRGLEQQFASMLYSLEIDSSEYIRIMNEISII